MRNDECTTCAGFGYTIVNTEEGETMTGCFECFVAAHEAEDEEFIVLLDDGDEITFVAATAEDAMDDARERGYRATSAVAA